MRYNYSGFYYLTTKIKKSNNKIKVQQNTSDSKQTY